MECEQSNTLSFYILKPDNYKTDQSKKQYIINQPGLVSAWT